MANASDRKILIVDDEPDVRSFLTACIQDAGFQVNSAVNGDDALEKINAWQPDLMTLDLVMPRKSGIQLIRTLRESETWSRLPVIVITAHARDEFASEDIKSLNAFASGLKPRRTIEKPVTPQVLVETICDILDVIPSPQAEMTEISETDRDRAELMALIQNSDPEMIQQIKGVLKAV